MRRIIVDVVLMAGAAFLLTGCGIADSHSPLPEFMRGKASEPPPLEPPPDVKQLVREKLDSVFVSTSNPRQVQVSPPDGTLQAPGGPARASAEQIAALG